MPNVLFVDDFETVLDFLSKFLRPKGYEVCCAESKNAIDKSFLSFHADIILLDVKLNGDDGRMICKEIKSIIADFPVILISANATLLEDFKLCDANDIIEKPFELDQVLEKIEKALRTKPM